MKLAIAGKGGVGKTTLASLLAAAYARSGRKVIAIDADPDANFASALGVSTEEAARITPISELRDLIEERTGAKPGTIGGFFKMNPKVDDIPDRFSARVGDVRLMQMGSVKGGGSGCVCPESTLLKNLVSHLLLERSEVVIMDMEAGLEHLARGTSRAMDAILIVVEPGKRSLQTAEAIRRLAADLEIRNTFVVGSKVKNEHDRHFITSNMPQFQVLGFIDHDPSIEEADRRGMAIADLAPKALEQAEEIRKKLEGLVEPGRKAKIG